VLALAPRCDSVIDPTRRPSIESAASPCLAYEDAELLMTRAARGSCVLPPPAAGASAPSDPWLTASPGAAPPAASATFGGEDRQEPIPF
jgi:hypothetical protein